MGTKGERRSSRDDRRSCLGLVNLPGPQDAGSACGAADALSPCTSPDRLQPEDARQDVAQDRAAAVGIVAVLRAVVVPVLISPAEPLAEVVVVVALRDVLAVVAVVGVLVRV